MLGTRRNELVLDAKLFESVKRGEKDSGINKWKRNIRNTVHYRKNS